MPLARFFKLEALSCEPYIRAMRTHRVKDDKYRTSVEADADDELYDRLRKGFFDMYDLDGLQDVESTFMK